MQLLLTALAWENHIGHSKDAVSPLDSEKSMWGFQRLPVKIYSESGQICTQNAQLKENIEKYVYDLGIGKASLHKTQDTI